MNRKVLMRPPADAQVTNLKDVPVLFRIALLVRCNLLPRLRQIAVAVAVDIERIAVEHEPPALLPVHPPGASSR